MGKTTATQPLKGLAPWVGGKHNLAEPLIERIERVPHEVYAEVFLGMGNVFLRRRHRAAVEVVNDRSGDVVNLFRVVKYHPAALFHELDLQLYSREDFDRLCKLDPATLTDVQRAARFYWIHRCNFSGKVGNRSFPVRIGGNLGPTQRAFRRHFAAVSQRLDHVMVENLPFEELIDRYDSEKTLFYLDPPYWGKETLYGPGLFSRSDFQRLADQLTKIAGRFILSLNDVPEVRETFAAFHFEEVSAVYTAALGPARHVTELIISDGPREGDIGPLL